MSFFAVPGAPTMPPSATAAMTDSTKPDHLRRLICAPCAVAVGVGTRGTVTSGRENFEHSRWILGHRLSMVSLPLPSRPKCSLNYKTKE